MSAAEPVVALLPGHLGDARIYAPQIAALGLQDAVAADHRRDADLGAMAERFLRDAPEQVALIGLSLGGMLALEIIDRAPERVAGAALLATDAGAARPLEIEWRSGVIDEVMREGEPALRRFGAGFIAKFFTHSPAAHRRLGPGLEAMAEESADVPSFLNQARALSGRRDNHAALARFAEDLGRPVLLIAGAEDKLCPPLLHRRMKQAAPSADLILLENCGHLLTLESPDLVNVFLQDWLGAL